MGQQELASDVVMMRKIWLVTLMLVSMLSNFVSSAKRGGPQITQMSSNARLKSVMGNFLCFNFLKLNSFSHTYFWFAYDIIKNTVMQTKSNWSQTLIGLEKWHIICLPTNFKSFGNMVEKLLIFEIYVFSLEKSPGCLPTWLPLFKP